MIVDRLIENAEGFLEDYILDLYHDLRDSIYYGDGLQTKIQTKIDTALEIATGLGAKITKDEDVLVLPYISIDWDKVEG